MAHNMFFSEWKIIQNIFLLSLLIRTGPGCSKRTASLVNFSLRFQMSIPEIRQYFCWKNVRSFCSCSAKASLFFQQKISVYLVIKS